MRCAVWKRKTHTDVTSPSKPSRPARAYLRVKEQTHLDLLSTKVKQTTFQDAKNTSKDPCLLGPPSLEFAPFPKIPGSRVRHDGRQGTIDQDQEFIDFLQSLTEPVAKTTGNGEDSDLKQGKVTTTPLVQFIKEKKANKAKEALAAKSAKASAKADAKEAKPEKPAPKVSVIKAASSPEKGKRDKASQEAVKAANKSVAAMTGKAAPAKGPGQAVPAATKDSSNPQPPVKRERERGNASIAAKILQRDLGLGPKERKPSGATKTAASSAEPAKGNVTPAGRANLPGLTAREDATQPSAHSTQSATEPKITLATPPTGPRSAKPAASAPQPPKSTTAPAVRPPKPNPVPSAGAKSAFLKHANPSQGVTEPLLEAAFTAFGTLTRCEIDKKKGFGYVDFADPEGLKKAMQASPIKVGSGQVVVLENKSKPAAKAPVPQGPANIAKAKAPPSQIQSPPIAPSQVTKSDTASTTTAPTPKSPANASSALAPTPTAPRGAPANVRGSRGGPMGPARGGFGPSGRAGRGGFRGRGGFSPTQPRGGSSADAVANTTAKTQLQASTAVASPSPAPKSPATDSAEPK